MNEKEYITRLANYLWRVSGARTDDPSTDFHYRMAERMVILNQSGALRFHVPDERLGL